MKKSALVLSVFLIALVVVAWCMQIGNLSMKNSEYQESIRLAEEYQAQGLFQKAAAAYEDALALKENRDLRQKWLEANQKGYHDGVITAKTMEKVYTLACEQYPNDVVFWEQNLEHYVQTGNYTGAYSALKKLNKSKAASDKLEELTNKVRYSFFVSNRSFKEYYRSPLGYYTVNNGIGWGVIDPSGEVIRDCDYTYIGPFSDDGFAVYVSEKDYRVLGKDSVVETIIKEEFTRSGAYGSGMLPVYVQEGKWKFLDCSSGTYKQDTYEAASNFVDGIAAVCKNGKWMLINSENEQVGKNSFDNVKLHSNGDYVYQGIMIASVNGNYGIYDKEGNAIKELTYKDMDVYCGGYIAFCDESGKWGFVDKKGSVKIQPAFKGAKSFSNGLAGVKENDTWGFVNTKGALVIPCDYMNVEYFSESGCAMVCTAEGHYSLMKLRFKK